MQAAGNVSKHLQSDARLGRPLGGHLAVVVLSTGMIWISNIIFGRFPTFEVIFHCPKNLANLPNRIPEENGERTDKSRLFEKKPPVIRKNPLKRHGCVLGSQNP